MNRKTLALVSILIVAILVIGIVAYVLVSKPPATVPTLVIGTTEREETLDPADAYNYMSVNLLQNTMATLLTYSDDGTGTVVPMLLTTVPTLANQGISADGLNYTLHLRSGATFEDGTVIDATVVKYSIDRSLKEKPDLTVPTAKVLPVPSFLLDAIKDAHEYLDMWDLLHNRDPANHTQAEVDAAWANYSQDGVEVVDASTVIIHMGYAWSPMQLLLAFTNLAPVNPNKFPMDQFKPLATDISASGPYRVSAFVSGERAELVRNPSYFGTPAKMERVVIKFYADAPGLNLGMQNGEIDIAYRNLNPEDFNAFKSNTNVVAQQGTSAVIRYLVFNVRDPPFDNANLRRAFAYAVNRTSIVDTVFLGSTEPLYSLIPRGMFGHQDAFQTAYARNVSRARAMIEAEGYSTVNKLSFTLWYTPARYGTTEADVATLIKQQWEETGVVSVTLNSQEWGTYRQSFKNGAFNVFLLGWFPDYLDPDDYTTPFLRSGAASASFGCFYGNATVDNLLTLQGQQGIDSSQRAQTFSDIQNALAADVPYLPLWQTTQQVVYKKGITGVILDTSQFFRYFTIQLP